VNYELPWSFDNGIDVPLWRRFSLGKVLVMVGIAYLKRGSKARNTSGFIQPVLFTLDRLAERSGVDHAAKVLVRCFPRMSISIFKKPSFHSFMTLI
jgi:hypothetical protein